MKLNKLTAALALVAGLSSAQAATTTFTIGDAFIGFRTGTSGSNLEVNLGQVGQFSSATDSILDFSSKLSVQDLIDTYGSSWASSTTLKFGTFAAGSKTTTVAGQPSGTLWFGMARADGATLAASPVRKNASGQGFVIDQVAAFATKTGTNLQGFAGQTSTGNSTVAFVADGTLAGSYNKLAVNPNDTALWNSAAEKKMTGSLGTAGSLDAASAGSWALQDLYLLNPGSGAGTYLGTFGLALADTTTADGSIRAAGTLLFETNSAAQFTAIPEPSTYAAILGALTVGFVALRRRFSKAV